MHEKLKEVTREMGVKEEGHTVANLEDGHTSGFEGV